MSGLADPDLLAEDSGLADSLHEWARVVDEVSQRGEEFEAAAAGLVSRRGRQLAGRVAAVVGRPVRYVDPVTGEISEVNADLSATATPRRPAESVPEPTPWSTGLILTAFTAVVVVFAVLVLSWTMAAVNPWLAAVANVMIAVALAPSVWTTRRVLVWRWVSLGVVAGLGLSWCTLLLALL